MFFTFLLTLSAVVGSPSIWPPPQFIDASGESVQLHSTFSIETNHNSNRLLAAIKRYSNIISQIQSKSHNQNFRTSSIQSRLPALLHLRLDVLNGNEYLGENTHYDYRLQVRPGDSIVNANATSIYGAMYALESFVQLVRVGPGSAMLMYSSVSVVDAPQYAWRGLMIDTGRRFFPMPLVKNLLDTLSANKMNVLHLHASDLCRFSVESKKFPNLTASLTGIHAGFYTQTDIADMIAYAGDRGIRVVPEFDVPGHSRGFIPLESKGIQFCTTGGGRSQLYGDPANKTYSILHEIFQEMSTLFKDKVFNIGCDETGVSGPCTQQSTFNLERKLFNAIENEFGKTPEGWEEAYFNAGAATNNTIVNAWARHTAAQITKTGRRAVESSDSHFYFTSPGAAGPAGWKKCWYDIATGVASAHLHLLLGGEISMWSDSYCYLRQCDPTSTSKPVGYKLFDPKNNKEFGQSIGGMIWPRGYVAAAAFWNFNTSFDPSSDATTKAIYKFNDDLIARGSWACPSTCHCDQLTACGKPYLQPVPPSAGDILTMAPCDEGITEWEWTTSGPIYLRANKSLCIHYESTSTYPLTIEQCLPLDTWIHNPNTSTVYGSNGSGSATFLQTSESLCMDLSTANGAVGTWKCGSAQPNQEWSYDSSTGAIVSMSQYHDATRSAFAGTCITTVPK